MATDLRDLIEVSYDFALNEDDADAYLNQFRPNLAEVINAMSISNVAIKQMISTVLGLPRATTEFNSARTRFVRANNSYVESVDLAKELVELALGELDKLIEWLNSDRS